MEKYELKFKTVENKLNSTDFFRGQSLQLIIKLFFRLIMECNLVLFSGSQKQSAGLKSH